jgi:hypothetical protein
VTARLRSALQHLALALFPLTLLLVVAEVAVRVTGAAETCPSDFGDEDVWTCDPILHFKMNPKLRPHDEPLNSDGFRGAEFTPKRPGVFRILALGDSCTLGTIAFGRIGFAMQPYPRRLQRLVERRLGEGPWRCSTPAFLATTATTA